VRVAVDGRSVLDGWHEHAATTFTGEMEVDTGHHLVTVEYFEARGDALIRLDWAPLTSPDSGFLGEYFTNATLAGAPVMTRDDPQVDFDWGTGPPIPGVIPANDFSVRWTGRLVLSAGTYSFQTTTDDGVRLWVNGHLLIDRWYDQAVAQHDGRIYLPGPSDLRMEYYDHTGSAVARLRWSAVTPNSTPSPGQGTVHIVQRGDTLYSLARRYGTTVAAIRAANGLTADRINVGQRLVIPTGTPATPPPSAGDVVVDELAAGFRRGGSATGWHSASVGHTGHMLWTLNNDVRRADYNWARWYPQLIAGRYEVFAFVPRLHANTQRATYWIAHADGFSSRIVDQSRLADAWASLGTYRFDGTGDEYVSLNDITGEPRLSRRIGFDAVRWSRR
jgi:hypothetical protein